MEVTGYEEQGKVRIRVTFRRVRVIIAAPEKQQVLHILSVSVALGIQHAVSMRHIAICGLFGSTIIFHITS
jgi:hypothetical protein